MTSSGPFFLRIHRVAEPHGVECHVAPVAVANAIRIDGCQPVAELWANYSHAVETRFHQTFPVATLETAGLPLEVIEAHLLLEIYKPHAFVRLVAERLADLVLTTLTNHPDSSRSREVLLSLPPTAGNPTAVARELQILLRRRQTSTEPSAASGWITCGKAWLYGLAGLLATNLNLLKLLVCRRKQVWDRTRALPQNLWLVFHGTGHHTRHIWQWLRAQPPQPNTHAVLILGHTPIEKDLIQAAQQVGATVQHLVSATALPAATWRVLRRWPALIRLHQRAASDLDIPIEPALLMQTAAWLCRGLVHAHWLRAANLTSARQTLGIFGLIAHADSRLVDLVLRQRGVTTVHWLHGIVEDSLHYRANATVCLCQTPGDAALRTQHGNYQSCIAPPRPAESALTPPAISPPGEGLLVVTNLIHPDNRFIRAGAPEALAKLLQLVADHAGRKKITPLTWRPHPRESASAEFSRFKDMAEQLGYQVDNSIPMAEQVRVHRLVLTTFSGSIGDVAAAGRVPLVYAGLPYEKTGHWSMLPTGLAFSTESELEAGETYLANTAQAANCLHSLCQQYHKPPPQEAEIASVWERIRDATQ